MSDFLKNLKNKDRTTDTRHHQPYRENYHNNYDRRNEMERRNTYHRKPNYENPMSTISKLLPDIQNLLTMIAENQKSQVDIYERISKAEERVNKNLNQIASALKVIAIHLVPEATNELQKIETIRSSEDQGLMEFETSEISTHDKDKIIRMIVEMRDNGSTFEMIAQHLDNENIATFSNRGKWHAQTIHRLYKQNKSDHAAEALHKNEQKGLPSGDDGEYEDEEELGPSF